MSQGEQLTERADPELVRLAGYPEPVAANVGEIMRQRIQEEALYHWIEVGAAVIRRAALARFGRPDPASGQEITVRGKVYRIEHVSADSLSLRVAFQSVP